MMNNLLLWLFAWCWRVLTLGRGWRLIKVAGCPYLLRIYLWRRVYLHYFFRPDLERGLHNHPWDVSSSRILSGWYLEQRLHTDPTTGDFSITERYLDTGDVNTINAQDFHRIDRVSKGCWTMFRPGTRCQRWGFLDTETGLFELADD